jgi:hypothetical protein
MSGAKNGPNGRTLSLGTLRRLLLALVVFSAGGAFAIFVTHQRQRIGAIAVVTEVSSGLPFEARVDTGAANCSIHCEKWEIENESSNPKENVGKSIRFLIKNKKGQTAWIESEIAEYSGVRTAAAAQVHKRYLVYLQLRFKYTTATVLTSLTNREAMPYAMLLGRNFLYGRFIVDVDLDADRDFF